MCFSLLKLSSLVNQRTTIPPLCGLLPLDPRMCHHIHQHQPHLHTSEFPAYLQDNISLAFLSTVIIYEQFKSPPHFVKTFNVVIAKAFSCGLVCHVLRSALLMLHKSLILQMSNVLRHSVKMLECRGVIAYKLVRRQRNVKMAL